MVQAHRRAFRNIHDDIEDLLAEDDRVMVRWRVGGKHRGEFMGMDPSGKRLAITGITVFRLSGGWVGGTGRQAPYTAWHELVLEPGQQHTMPPNTKH